ncbi:MAG: DUF2070 family protein [Candidatus Bathyarchaeia archaeon]
MALASLYGGLLWYPLEEGLWGAGSSIPPAAFGALALLLPSILSPIFVEGALLRGDGLFHMRRRMALSLVSLIVWDLGMTAERLISNGPPVASFLLATMFAIFLRTLSLFAISSKGLAMKILAAIGQPAISGLIAARLFGLPFDKLSTSFMIGAVLSISYSSLILVYIERTGKAKLGSSPILAFRALLSDWLGLDRAPLEAFMEGLGERSEISISTIAFRRKGGGELLGIMVVSNFHPGPFLNVGSSALPYAIQRILKELTGAVVCVPHGISGHDLNTSSSLQNRVLIERVLESLNFERFHEASSPQIEVALGDARCKCQVLGDCLLMIITTAPKEMEDIPPSAVSRALNAIESIGLKPALIDSHNCMDDSGTIGAGDPGPLGDCALAAVSMAIREGRHRFKFGAAEARPIGMGPREGIGPGGVVVFVLEILSKKVAYVVVDGNNMKRGLREEILKVLSEVGISSGEVMTTDTHIVNGLAPSKLGYPVVGDVGRDGIIGAVKEAAIQAQSRLEEAEVACERRKVEVKTLGQFALESLVRSIWGFSRAVAYSAAIFAVALTLMGLWAIL